MTLARSVQAVWRSTGSSPKAVATIQFRAPWGHPSPKWYKLWVIASKTQGYIGFANQMADCLAQKRHRQDCLTIASAGTIHPAIKLNIVD